MDQIVPKIRQWFRDSGHAHRQSVGHSSSIQEFFAGSNQKIRSPSVRYTSTHLHLIDQASSRVNAAPSLAEIEPKIAPTAKEIDIIINGLVKAAPNRISCVNMFGVCNK